METLVIVGAGATLAEALPSRPPRINRPPLDTTFFELCRIAKLPGRRIIKQYMLDYGIDPFSCLHRMEEVFNYIYSDAFSKNSPIGCLSAYWALLRMYAMAIARTTNRINGTGRYGIGALLRCIWKSDPNGKITIITFNQDLLIEKALDAMALSSTFSKIPWNLELTYDISFVNFGELPGKHERFCRINNDSIKILKLHGSLNWVYAVRSGADPSNSIRSPSKRLHCINNKDILDSLRYRPKKRWTDLVPLIVPPIYEKASRYQQAIGPLWHKASLAIERAERVVVFGYSFPETDFASRSLFRRSFHRNNQLTEISVIDLDHNAAAKIGLIGGAKATHHYLDVQMFTRSCGLNNP